MAPELNAFTATSLGLSLVAALGASLHCVAMCGPLRMLTNSNLSARLQYQGGRLATYLALGFLAGSLGAVIPWYLLLPLVLGAVALSLVKVNLPLWQKVRGRALHLASAQPFLLGSASGLLPCGLLHVWIAAAGASASGFHGAAMLLMLWLGTLPALELGSEFFQRLLGPLRRRFPRALPLVLILLAVAPILYRSASGLKPTAESGNSQPSCHGH